MDIASFGGIVLAVLGIVGGMLMEGGSLKQITQPTALMIVLGGTAGAVMVQFPMNVIVAAARQVGRIFVSRAADSEANIALLVGFAIKARRNGILSLDEELESVKDGFMKQALMLAIDGTEPAEVRAMMQLSMENRQDFEEQIPHVLEAAGGFAPTVGIIGAVLGLIQVMQHLDHIDEVGRGIAVAFVATIYGVGLANLVCLPAAGKMRIRQREEQVAQTIMLEGVISILEGMNPRMMEAKLRTYLFDGKRAAKEKGRREIEVPA